MSNTVLALKQAIAHDLAAFGRRPLLERATALFETLGYRSEKRLELEPPASATFSLMFGQPDAEKSLIADWQMVDMVFQLTDAEIRDSAQIGLFDSSTQFDGTIIESYLVFAIRLSGSAYTRTQLAEATRAINKCFHGIPVMVLFYYNEMLTLSIIKRRLNKQDSQRDVLEKVTLIKDIRCANPHRAHIEILFDLALPQLVQKYPIRNFVSLQQAWQIKLDSTELNKRFYNDLSNWYFWAVDTVRFPEDAGDEHVRNPISVIRMITRVMFIWFLREKDLIPDQLFRKDAVDVLLQGDDRSRYYKAILQNLFFATLNQEMSERGFRKSGQNYNVTSLYRYQDFFRDPAQALELFAPIPFLNGGLFECLDQTDETNTVLRVDGFSDRADNVLCVPDELFWASEHTIDLNKFYGTKGKSHKVRGLIPLLDSYKFTITENTPLEEEIALDPELLGRVFENLLASYNEDTQDTARKQTGSFYTPRDVVNYMVDESLLLVFKQSLLAAAKLTTDIDANPDSLDLRLNELLSYSPRQASEYFSETEIRHLIANINTLALLDPACGSGAFPMGALQKLVHVLSKLDPQNRRWKEQQEERAQQLEDAEARQSALKAIENAFELNELDYGRKLYLIENTIYGVDIQPIAVQISKLRFFIALIVDQKVDDKQPNRGVRPLPNLETKFVAANTLRDIGQLGLRTPQVESLELTLERVRRDYFNAKTLKNKHKYRQQDRDLRNELSRELQATSLNPEQASLLAQWDPYNQNRFASFFNPEWMFGRTTGFDVVIGNPPYIRQEKLKEQKPWLKDQYSSFTGVADLYVYFYELGIKLLRKDGVLTYISSNKWLRAGYGEKLRKYLAANSRVSEIIDFGELPVFEAATFPMIFFAQRGQNTSQTIRFTQVKSLAEPYPNIPAVVAEQGVELQSDAIRGADWTLSSADIAAILRQMERRGVPLRSYVEGKIFYGVKTGFNDAFVIDNTTRKALIAKDPRSAEIIKPLAVGDDVRKWTIRNKGRWLIFTRRGINIDNYPAIKNHLAQWQQELTPRTSSTDKLGRKPGRYKWYEIQDEVAYFEQFDKPKIIYPVIAKESRFSFDTKQSFTNDKAFIIPKNDLYLLGVLNSTITWSFLKSICSVLGDPEKGGRLELRSIYMEKIPIPKASTSVQRLIETLVEYVIYLAQAVGEGPEAGAGLMDAAEDSYMLGYFERLIDGLVYELFFPAELQAAGCELAKPLLAAALPPLAALGVESMEGLRAINRRIYAPDHPVRTNLFFLDSIEVVQMIEGKR